MAKNYVSYENAQVLVQGINDKIDSKFSELGGAYIARGSRAFADLPETLTESMVGYVYNITDDFKTDGRFVDGLEKKYSAGTNVVVVDAGTDENHDYKLDVLSSFVDVEAIEDRIQEDYDAAIDYTQGQIKEAHETVEGRTAPAFDSGTIYNAGDVVIFKRKLYRCLVDGFHHDFSASYFEQVTVAQLIDSAAPDSLTQEQMNSLLAIL